MTECRRQPSLDLLILADLHFVESAQHECPIPRRRADLGPELIRRAWERAVRQGAPDAVVLMGDLVDNGNADRADQDLQRLRDELADTGVPILVVPGNHDGDPRRLLRIFGDQGGAHELNGCQLLTFADHYGEDDRADRSRDGLALVQQTRREHPASPIIAFQHSPVHPPIDSSYPYNLANRDDVMAAYADAGVALSISGHYHDGQPLTHVDGVGYATCPALCEAPFRFLRLTLRGGDIALDEIALAVDPKLALVDHHAHTQFAYCADDITAQSAIARARDFGLAGITFAEHAGQLYLSQHDYWQAAFLHDPGSLARERAAGRDRMQRYRGEIAPLRSDFVRVGLEVECDSEGQLTLLDEDREGWDLLIGAVHYLPKLHGGAASAEVQRAFMQANERMCEHAIDVLAHPFRIFRRGERSTPTELYEPIAELLSATGVAAEINYHTNEPAPRFFELCLERGVRIVLGSDAHALHEVGEFGPHLELVRQLGEPQDVLTCSGSDLN
ncbi:MAG: metallophosphoesterase [Armatimonadota bacterium]|jgi:histidinol phosphatase-like PHP family hydrolase